MNERIKALMGETLDSEFSHTWDTMTYEGLLQFSEKFAELLMKECADYVDSAISDGGVDGRSLKEHFGVKE